MVIVLNRLINLCDSGWKQLLRPTPTYLPIVKAQVFKVRYCKRILHGRVSITYKPVSDLEALYGLGAIARIDDFLSKVAEGVHLEVQQSVFSIQWTPHFGECGLHFSQEITAVKPTHIGLERTD
ncbi:MAG: hypothetical protein AAFN78_10515 [Pseudomonadota bacterium]